LKVNGILGELESPAGTLKICFIHYNLLQLLRNGSGIGN